MLSGLCTRLDTMFNERQLPLLIDELDRLPPGVALDDESRAVTLHAGEDMRRLVAELGDLVS